MSDHEFENYLTLISRFLRLSAAQREAIGQELRDHFESRLAELLDQGLAHDKAVRLALEEFGDAAGLAAQFCNITQTRRRRLVMRCTVASVAALAAAVVVAMAVWPENQAGKVVGKAMAQPAEFQKAALDTNTGQDALTAQTRSKLDRFLTADYNDLPLSEFLDEIGNTIDVQFYVDGVALRDAAIDPTALPISIHLKRVRAKMLLGLVLGQYNLGYTIRDGIMIVSTDEKLGAKLTTCVYDCRAILEADARKSTVAPAPVTEKPSVEKKSSDGGVNSSGSFGGTNPSAPHAQTGSVDADSLINVITATIAAPTWDCVGGQGTIAYYNGLLVISQTQEVHEDIADLLDQIANKLGVSSKK